MDAMQEAPWVVTFDPKDTLEEKGRSCKAESCSAELDGKGVYWIRPLQPQYI